MIDERRIANIEHWILDLKHALEAQGVLLTIIAKHVRRLGQDTDGEISTAHRRMVMTIRNISGGIKGRRSPH